MGSKETFFLACFQTFREAWTVFDGATLSGGRSSEQEEIFLVFQKDFKGLTRKIVDI